MCVATTPSPSWAATLDLAGVDKTVADVAELADYDGVENSSPTLATLTFDISTDQTYSGALGGVRLHVVVEYNTMRVALKTGE